MVTGSERILTHQMTRLRHMSATSWISKGIMLFSDDVIALDVLQRNCEAILEKKVGQSGSAKNGSVALCLIRLPSGTDYLTN